MAIESLESRTKRQRPRYLYVYKRPQTYHYSIVARGSQVPLTIEKRGPFGIYRKRRSTGLNSLSDDAAAAKMRESMIRPPRFSSLLFSRSTQRRTAGAGIYIFRPDKRERTRAKHRGRFIFRPLSPPRRAKRADSSCVSPQSARILNALSYQRHERGGFCPHYFFAFSITPLSAIYFFFLRAMRARTAGGPPAELLLTISK